MIKNPKQLTIDDEIFTIVEKSIESDAKIESSIKGIAESKFYVFDTTIIDSIAKHPSKTDYVLINGVIALPRTAETPSQTNVLDKYYTDKEEVVDMCKNLSLVEVNRITDIIDRFTKAQSFINNQIEKETFN